MFWWGEIERSVRIEGTVEKVSSEESDIYFNMRPPMARIGALASDQSRPIASRAQLDKKFDQLSEFYLNPNGEEKTTIERPSQWGGYRLIPLTIEFWKGRASRIHDRIKYTQVDLDSNLTMKSTWTRVRLQP
jgi:pyridoxamine 5'-phosphate oxidase